MARTKLILGPPEVIVERRPDGVILARSPHSPGAHARAATDWLDHWAAAAPERVFLAERERGDAKGWRTVTYAQARDAARSVAQGLIDRGLSVERPVAILSGNSVDHALLGLGAMIAGVPYAPVSAPYSLVSKDFAKLRAIMAALTPGLVFVDDGDPFAAALEAAVPKDVEAAARTNPPASRRSCAFEALLATKPTEDVERAQCESRARHDRKIPVHLRLDRHAEGRDQHPAHADLEPAGQGADLGVPRGGADLVILDWLPWSHTFGANHNFNLVLRNGGTLYIDGGKPAPGLFATSLRQSAQRDADGVFQRAARLRHADRRVARRTTSCAAASSARCSSPSTPVPRCRRICGTRSRNCRSRRSAGVADGTGVGSTETSPLATDCHFQAQRSGNIGVPIPAPR